jgi:hypothetical protein
VYQRLYERGNLGAFDRIASSEQRHFSPIGTPLARYNVTDLVQNDARGIFTDPRLAALSTDLAAKWALSLKDALEVGVLSAWPLNSPWLKSKRTKVAM